MKYTQRQWDRVVGYGKVPDEYSHVSDRETDGQDSKRGNKTREEVYRTVREIQEEWTLDDPRWDKRWTEDVAETNPIETQENP